MPTLAELRAQSGPKPLPRAERTVTLIEGQHLLADAQRLSEERDDLLAAGRRADDDGNPIGPPQKAGQGAKESRERAKRLEEIPGEMAAIVARLGDHQGEIGLTGLTGGDWQRFKDDNPPREDNKADVVYARAHCNATAVFEALGRFVATWDGEAVTQADWDGWLAERITYADRRELITEVVMLHEQGMNRAPKLPRSSSTTASSETA